MTPLKHAEASARRHGGKAEDYLALHDWFDETKQYTGDWTHRALRHHAVGVQEACRVFGHIWVNSDGAAVATKLLAEQHVMEDCGFVPAVTDWLGALRAHPEPWMLRVPGTKKVEELEVE